MLLIGNNSMTLNAATMCAIVEKHLNDSLGYSFTKEKQIKVSTVKVNSTDGTYTFDVTVEEKQDA